MFYQIRILRHCKKREMPGDEIAFRSSLTEDIDQAKVDEMHFYEQKWLKRTMKTVWYKRLDWNLIDVWQRRTVGPIFVLERFYCSNLLFLERIIRRKDMKALLKYFNGAL